MINGIQDMAFLAGIVMGSVLLLSVCWVWVKKQVLGSGGVVMSLVGVTLVGLAVWSSVQIEASPDGFSAKFEQLERELDDLNTMVVEVDENVQEVVQASLRFSENMEVLATSVTTNGEQFRDLSRRLETSNVISTDAIQQNIQIPAQQLQERIRVNQEALQRIDRSR